MWGNSATISRLIALPNIKKQFTAIEEVIFEDEACYKCSLTVFVHGKHGEQAYLPSYEINVFHAVVETLGLDLLGIVFREGMLKLEDHLELFSQCLSCYRQDSGGQSR